MSRTVTKSSLRSKLTREMVATLLAATLTIGTGVTYLQWSSADAALTAQQARIREALINKGRSLVANQTLALRNLVADNAISDVSNLILRTVDEDPDVVHGLFLNAELRPWTYISPTHPTLDSPDEGGAAAASDEWKALGLTEDELERHTEGTRHLTLFNQEIYEFSGPVQLDKEFLGTLRYGLSTQRMQAALEQARQESRASLLRTLTLLGALVVVNLGLGVFLARRRATRITLPLKGLTHAAEAIGAGNYQTVVQVQSNDELEVLGQAFNKMVREVEDSYRTLEQKVRDRTLELSERGAAMRMVLDNVEQGLGSILLDGTLGLERSATFDKWFGPCEPGTPFWTHLAANQPEAALTLQASWEAVIEGILPLELTLDQMPRTLTLQDRHYVLEYRPVLTQDILRGVLMVVTDITREKQRLRNETEQRERLHIFEHIMKDRAGFLEFIAETDRLVQTLAADAGSTEAVKLRTLHTLKGNCGLFGIESVSSLCHEIETRLAEQQESIARDLAELTLAWNNTRDRANNLLGSETSDQVRLTRQELSEFGAVLWQKTHDRALVDRVTQLSYEPVEHRFKRIGEKAQTLAERLGRAQLDIHIEANAVRLPQERWAPFWSSFAHVVRNAVDHGVGTTEARIARGKPARARIELRARVQGSTCTIEVSDDGAGVDWEKIRTRAIALGLPHKTQAELVNALFTGGVSTKAEASEISGRGIGMGAVRQTCSDLGGTMDLISTPEQGTTIRFRFPIPPTPGSA